MTNSIIIISGATATGKTSTSLYLADELQKQGSKCSIVNFDSLLFYRELNIGTAKPMTNELAQVEHHLIDITSAKKTLNASDYTQLARKKIDELHNENKIVLLVGGSGFYLRALIKGMYAGIPSDPATKERANNLLKHQGIDPFLKILDDNDPESFKTLHPNDHYRIIRAVEYFWSTGNKFSSQKNTIADPYDFSTPCNKNWNILHLYLDIPKSDHYEIICKRTKMMIQQGLVDEVTNLLDLGFTGNEKPLQSIGYKETINFIQGHYNNSEDFMERISISTRQLAKAQRTWFNKIKDKTNFNPLSDDFQKQIIKAVISRLHQ